MLDPAWAQKVLIHETLFLSLLQSGSSFPLQGLLGLRTLMLSPQELTQYRPCRTSILLAFES